MIITTCWILWIPVAVDALVDGLDRDGPLDEQPTDTTATTTATIPTCRAEGKRIRARYADEQGAKCAATLYDDRCHQAVNQRSPHPLQPDPTTDDEAAVGGTAARR
jgi:hypothetical protein